MSTIRDPAYITNAGRTMMTTGGEVTYTKAVLYGQDISGLSDSQIKALISLGNPLREVKIGVSDKQSSDSGSTVILEAVFQNNDLKADLQYKAVGFFARKNDVEQLVIVAVANSGAYLAATNPDGVATDALDLKIAVKIGDATSVTAVVDPAGSVTPATLNGAINKATHDLTAKIDTKADKTDVTAQFATKADKTTVEQELTTKANASDVYTKKQVDDALSSRDTAIATKADKATVDAEISKIDFTPYAKTADVNKQIKTVTDLANSKVSADYSYSKAELDKKLLAVTTDTSGKVNATQVASMIADKADTSTVNAQIADVKNTIKSNVDNLQSAINTKANASDVYTKKQVDDALSSRDTAIATKADKATVDAEISKIDFTPYAKTADVNKQIKTVTDLANSKVSADYSYSKAELDKKLLAVTTDTSGKVNATQVASMIADKADTSTVNAQIADVKNTIKSNVDNLQSAINTKANASDVYTKKQVGDAFSNRDNSISNLINRVKQIDGETVIGNAVDVNTLEGTPNQVTVYKLSNTSNTNTPSWIGDHRGVMIVLNYDGNAKTQIWTPVGSGAFNKDGSFGWRYWEGENPPDWNRLASVSYVDNLHNDLQNQINANDKGTITTGYDWNTGTPTNESRALQNAWVVDQAALKGAVDRMNSINSNANGRLSLDGGNMNLRSMINWTGGDIDAKTGNLGGLHWSGGTDTASIYGDQNNNDNLDLAFDLGDDSSNHFSFRNNGSEVAAIYSNGHFSGTVDWSNVSGHPDVATHADVNNAIDSIRYAPQERRSLGADDDANNIIDDGVYRISGNPIKNGNGKTWCFLRVKRWDYNTIYQELDCGFNGIFIRNISQTNNFYPGWQRIATSDDISNLQNIINQQNQTIQSLTTRLTNAENEIKYIKDNYIEGKRFPASQEAQAEAWENEKPTRLAMIEK
ncbi:phage-like protein [Lactobacillus helveticus]|uniref:Phage-like protein n=1 Tax=Lactobacillus helveticus TaxID=1587 RepID=A0A386RDM9_LACHE|nr:hypothetical protein [Lactobacillus helveticus]AYE61452.1 phage-like protein [Lactobacillus helveticus]